MQITSYKQYLGTKMKLRVECLVSDAPFMCGNEKIKGTILYWNGLANYMTLDHLFYGSAMILHHLRADS